MVMIKLFLLNFFGGVKMCDKMAISAYIFIIVENDPFLRKCLIVTNSFSTNKQYVKIKLMQNETNLWSIYLWSIEVFRYLSVLKLVMIQNLKTMTIRPLNQSFTNISCLPKKYFTDLFHIFCISLTFTYYLFVEKKLVMIWTFLITKELIFGFQTLDLKDHFSASLKENGETKCGCSAAGACGFEKS